MTSERITVVAVDDYSIDGTTVRLECATDSPETATSRTLPVTLEFYGPKTVRFELHANPEVRIEREYPDIKRDALTDSVALAVSEIDGTLVLDTGALEVVIGLDEWSFRIKDGEEILREQRHDTDVFARSRVDPLGFTQEEINHNPRRITETGTAFSLDPNEKLYGAGEQFVEFDRRGRELDLWHEEPLGTETPRAYKNIPFHLSSKGYGMLVETTARVHYDFGKTSTASASVSVADDSFAFIFFYGPDFTDILRSYTAMTGRPDRPPKWSFGTWMSRLGYESRDQLEAIVDRLREAEIPSDVVHLDPFWMRDHCSTDLAWDTEQFPDPEGMISGLHENDFRLSLWEHPHVPVGTEAFEAGAREGYFVSDGTGKPYVMDHTCQGDYRGALVDFTNTDAVEWWKDKHRRLLEMGVDVFKTDYGEYVPEDAVFANGKSGASMHNLYPYLYNKAVYEVVGEVNGTDEAIVWGRSAWTGSQRFPMHWGGDPQTTWNGMSAALRGGLSASLSGIAYWSHDIGGFRGTPTNALYTRWAQFGLLSSNARCHGTTPREPWEFGERALDIFREYSRIRYSLLPYIYTYAEIAARTGLPVIRPLVLEYQDDPNTHRLDTEYLVGTDLLVAPVFEASGMREVYLPEGEWISIWTDEHHNGNATISVDTPLEIMPIFLRAGSMIPWREPTETVHSGTPESLTLRTTLDADGTATGRFYDEDADELIDMAIVTEENALFVSFGNITADSITIVIDGPTPDAVLVNSTELTRVTEVTVSGEWTVDDDHVVVKT
ncbi:TIM-barrel domain-containing protein [Halocatena marina]|uniref:TIM-barrel domain-containing protein n=1 Tax=Halocatena marina TaxID=2934937 RepID=UPI00222455CB|nr:TIM-barrel domain-containing protein [Halocatena marina]